MTVLFSFFFLAAFVDFSLYRGPNLRVASDSVLFFSSSTVELTPAVNFSPRATALAVAR